MTRQTTREKRAAPTLACAILAAAILALAIPSAIARSNAAPAHPAGPEDPSAPQATNLMTQLADAGADAAPAQGLTRGFIGAAVEFFGTDLVVVQTVPGSPADKAGLAKGDTIVSIAGAAPVGQTLDAIVATLSGEPGSHLLLRIAPAAGTPTRWIRLKRGLAAQAK